MSIGWHGPFLRFLFYFRVKSFFMTTGATLVRYEQPSEGSASPPWLNIKRAIHSKMLGLFAWHSRCLSVGWLVGRLVDRLVCHNFLSLCGRQKLWITISFVLFRSRQNVQTYNIRRAIFTNGYISLEVQLDYVSHSRFSHHLKLGFNYHTLFICLYSYF